MLSPCLREEQLINISHHGLIILSSIFPIFFILFMKTVIQDIFNSLFNVGLDFIFKILISKPTLKA